MNTEAAPDHTAELPRLLAAGVLGLTLREPTGTLCLSSFGSACDGKGLGQGRHDEAVVSI